MVVRILFPRDVMHKRGLCRHAVCVCVSVTFVSCVKTNKDIFEIFSPPGSQAILVFPCQMGWRYYDGNPPDGGVECRWGRQKTRFWTNIWLRRIHVWSTLLSAVRVAKCEKQSRDGWRRASSRPRRPLFAQDDDEVFVTGSTLYAGDGGQPPPDTTPWS